MGSQSSEWQREAAEAFEVILDIVMDRLNPDPPIPTIQKESYMVTRRIIRAIEFIEKIPCTCILNATCPRCEVLGRHMNFRVPKEASWQ